MKFLGSLALPRVALSVVAEHYQIPMKRFDHRGIGGRQVGPRIVSRARMFAAWIARSIGGDGISYPAIGKAVGLHHSSVITGCQNVEKALAQDDGLRAVMIVLTSRVRDQLPPATGALDAHDVSVHKI